MFYYVFINVSFINANIKNIPTIPITTTVIEDYERATILAFIEPKLNL
jgi:hypothetical protein